MKELKQLVLSVDDSRMADIIASKIYMKFGETVQKSDSTTFKGYRLFVDEGLPDKRLIQIIGYAQGVYDTLTKPIF